MASNIGMSGFSGYDTAAMVDALVAAQKANLNRLQATKSKVTVTSTAWDNIAARARTLSATALQLSSPSALVTNPVASSDPTKIAVSGSTSSPVSVGMSVSALATAGMWQVSGFASAQSTVGAGTVTLSTGMSALGVAGVSSSSDVDADVTVVQSSEAARAQTSAVSLTVANSSLRVNYTTPSGSQSTTISVPGTYASVSALAAAVDTALAGTGVSASASGSGLAFSTDAEGSGYSLSFSGALAQSWGLNGVTAAGTDAVVKVGETSTTVTSLAAGAAVNVSAPSGSLTLTLGSSGGLRVGTGSVFTHTFSAGETVSDVATALSAASSPVYAAVVGGQGSTQLILSSRTSGSAADVTVGWAGFDLGTATRVRTGTDSTVTLGGSVFTRPSNVVTDLIPGATVTLLGTTSSEVTVSSAEDSSALLAKARSFITQVNDVLGALDTASKANLTDYTLSGPLASDSTARAFRRSLVSALNQQVGSGAYTSMSSIGVSVDKSGVFSLDETRFKAAVSADRESVMRVLSQGAATTDTRVGYAASSSSTVPGSYAVAITAAATKATVTGSTFTSLSTSETLSVTSGGVTASYTAAAGSTPASVAAGLQQALTDAGVTSVVAEATSSGAVRLSAISFGSSTSFTTTSTGTTSGLNGMSAVGSDVAGTIGGVAATGTGRTLTSSSGSATGLSLTITATQAEVTAAGGSLSLGAADFTRGASGLMRATLEAALASTGTLVAGKDSATRRATAIDAQIERENRRIAAYEARLQKQFSLLETTLSRLRGAVPQWPTVSSPNG